MLRKYWEGLSVRHTLSQMWLGGGEQKFKVVLRYTVS